MSIRPVAALLTAWAFLGALSFSAPARAGDIGNLFELGDFFDTGPNAVEPAGKLACRGSLHFGDALARYVTMTVDAQRGEIATPDCRKYQHLARFCRGTLLRIGEHRFIFGGAHSVENTKLWADLRRPSRLLTVSEDGTDIETMRVLFIGRCTAGGSVRVHHAARKRDP